MTYEAYGLIFLTSLEIQKPINKKKEKLGTRKNKKGLEGKCFNTSAAQPDQTINNS